MTIRSANKTPVQVFAALFLMGVTIGSVQAASIVSNGSFETAGASSDLAADWAVVDAVAQRRADRGASDPDYAMLFNTGGSDNGTISQVLNVETGLQYNLTFDLGMFWGAGTGPQTMRVKVNEGADGSGVGALNQVFTTTNTSNTPLINNWFSHLTAFQSFGSNQVLLQFIDESASPANANFDLALDNVAVNPVPLPPAAWLLGSALFGLLAIGKRKRQS